MNTVLDEQTLSVLRSVVGLATAPGYVWRHLASSSTVQSFAQALTNEELALELAQLLGQDNLDADQLTLAYCLLVALLLKEDGAVSAEAVPGLHKLRFAQDLVKANATRATVVALKGIQPRTSTKTPVHPVSSATTVAPNLRQSPRHQQPTTTGGDVRYINIGDAT